MKSRNIFFVLISFLIITFSSSCKKDEIKPDDIPQPTFSQKSKIVEKPEGLVNSTCPNAQKGSGYFDIINGMLNYFVDIQMPEDAKFLETNPNGSWTWTWEEGNFSAWLTYTENETEYIWDYDEDLSSERKNRLNVNEKKDGKHGEMKVYADNSFNNDTIIADYTWNYTEDGSLNFMSDFNTYKIIVNIKTDGSGDLKYYVETWIWYSVNWNADGSGSWNDLMNSVCGIW
jgi:hypothetical protein